jgi:hypothetical protein
MTRQAWVRAVVPAWLLCGVMDLSAAFLTSWLRGGVGPARVLKYVASGLLGPPAFEGGAGAAALGVAVHFTVALGAATAFFVASRRLGLLLRRPILVGVVYGLAVWVVMYLVVSPLSRIPPRTFTVVGTLIALVTHVVCVGLPISLMVKRGSAAPTPSPSAASASA